MQDPNTTLIPKATKPYAEVVQWCSFANHEVLPALGRWFRPMTGRDPYNKKNVEAAEIPIKSILRFLDAHLLHQTFLVGERLTIADLVMAAHLDRGFQYVRPEDEVG
jgi:elongation factor 1-gamma